MNRVDERVVEHLNEAKQYFETDRIIGIFLQGSQNYNLETEHSDVDTKLLVTPSFKDIAFNFAPVSTTHIRANDEHIDFKDVRLFLKTLEKQNINFVEILFTKYKFVNERYKKEWDKLVAAREDIARYNVYRAVKAMKGTAAEKFHAMCHPYPSKLKILKKYGYDPKQLHHLLRIEEFLQRYLNGEKYEACLIPTNVEYLKEVKLGLWDLDEAKEKADKAFNNVCDIVNNVDESLNCYDEEVTSLLREVQYNIMKASVYDELRVKEN